jgi:DNA-nicking Smr family endonuclease
MAPGADRAVKRELDPEDLRLWAIVAATVRPAHGRSVPMPPSDNAAPTRPVKEITPPAAAPRPRRAPPSPPQAIEPGRRHRIAHEREPLAARIDLHGMTYDAARAALTRFIARAQAEGFRAVLVITGKGALGDGVLRRHVPEWLAEAPSRAVVAGISEAHRRHGGEGALYVALKRRPRA